MKKRKGEHVVDEGTPEIKRKARDEKQSNHKSGEFARSLKGLLQKEHTRLSGLKQLLSVLKELQAKESIGDIIKEGGEFREIFTILEIGQQGLSKLEIQTCMEILESILLYTAEESQLANRLGVSIVQCVLQGHMKLLYSCLNPGNPPEVVKAALKLLTAMVTQGSSTAREVQSSFDFTLKSLGALPNKCDSNLAQDVRTCFIYFCLSFLMFGDLVVMKQILELKGFLQSVLKGLSLDKPEIVHMVLSTLQGRVVHNSGITKKTKVQFFNSHVLSQLANLYQYTKDMGENNSEEQTSDSTVRQKVHDLLLKVCGSFKFGICFFNVAGAFSIRSNNPVLLRFLQTLSSATTDVLVQELVITVLCCCHDVVRPFLSSLTATYEPRLSMHWIANMNLLTKVYIALPQPSIMVEKYGVKMTKEILPTLVNIVVPVGLSRTSLSRGVQHASYLVKHTTLSLVIVILNRAQNAVQCLASSEDTAEDLANTTDAPLVQQFREEVVKALPDVNTFVSLRQNLVSGKTKGESQGEDLASPTIFLAESLKIIHGFQLLSPSLLSHINFDLRKLLSGQLEAKLPVIAQQLTLQILLHAPPGSLKWFQQKGKSSASFLYSILNVYTSARNEKIKTDAQQLVQKLLSETGLLNSLPHANEVEMWLSHLCHSQFEEHTKTLLRFLDEVFMAVASEPYLYTDIVIDLQAEAVSHEASALQFGLDPTDWTQSSNTSLPVSLLLVGALKRYCEMISNATEPGEKAEVLPLGCIAKYMNCVISDMIHSAMNPTILCFVVCHYVSNTEVSQHMVTVRSAHKALLHYLSYWMPSFTQLQDKIDYLKVPSKTSNNSLKQLQSFLSRTIVQNEQEKATVSAELNRHLELLDEEQLGTVITDYVDFCKNQLSGQFSPLIKVLQVTNYRITGSSATEDIAPLLQALPFGVLVWQVLGEAIQGVKKTVNQWKTSTTDLSSFENETSSLLDNSWIQSLLVKALEKEPLVKTIPLCCHVLLYLRSLKAKLVVIRTSPESCMLRSAMQLCFELLQCLLQRLASLQDKMSEGKANASHETHNQGEMLFSLQSFDSPQNSCEPRCQGFSNVDNIYQTILHHPVIFDCFLWRPEHSFVGHLPWNIGTQLTYNVANVLLAVLPSLTVHQKRILMAPFVAKICKEGMLEIESANNGNVISSSQALYLLSLFHEYCDEENQVKFISHLSQLPSDMLVTTDAVSRGKVPSVCLTTLLTLLEGESFCEDHLSPLLSGRNPLKTEEPLLLSHFRQLVKISQDVNCPQLDYTILKLLQKSMLYVMGSTATFLDICLNQSTKAKIAIAAHLVKHCPSLRSHFELRCLDKPKPRKKPKALDITCTMFPVALKEHPAEFLPVVSSYLFCMRGISAEKLGCRTQAVVSHLVELYWAPLWAWLVSDREGIFKGSEELSMDVLTALILHMRKDNNLLKQLNGLLTRASLWDKCQLRICRQLLTSQYRNFSTNEDGVNIISKFCFACMEFLSSNLIKTDTNSDNEQVMEDSLDSLGWICENTVSISIVNEDCLTTWKNFVTNLLRYKFESSEVLRILSCIIKAIYKKQDKGESLPYGLLSLDTLYEMVLSHSRFLNILLSTDKNMDAKEKLADLMVTIVELSASCCKSSHLPVLFAAYSATLSATDQSILYLMNLYEKNHISFRNYRPFLWGPAAARHHQVSKSLGPSLLQQPTVTEVMEQMAASKMFQSAVSFPQGRLLQPQVQMEVACEGLGDLYDPCFLLPLFSCLLAPNFQVDCRKFVEQGCLGLSVAALSSRDGNMRKAGYHVLSRYMMHLDGVRFREKKQIFHLLTYLKNSITEEYCRLSSLMTCFLARVALILLKPEHPFYIMMNSFLLQRPALDLKDLPLFYNMFNSSTMQHATERSWMLQLLVDGMKDSPDYYLYKRRHVIELALSYHDSPVSDHRSQTLVTQLLLSALKIQPAAYDLTKNYGIVAWIHSLCYKSSARLQTSLDLLHTLWFTLQSPDKESGHVTEEEKPRRPPNLAPECSLVCWTLLEQLRSCSSVNCICRYLHLLASVLTCLETNGKPSGLSYDRIISLLRLWCETFQETVMLNQLLTTLNLSGKCDGVLKTTNAPPERGRANLKTEGLSSLLAVLLTWKPSGVETHFTVRLIWHFGLAQCQRKVLNFETPLVGEDQRINCIPSLLRWFKKCLVEDLTLQDLLVTEKSEVKLILQLFRVVPPTNTKSSVQIGDLRRSDPKSSLLTVMKELNMICLVLLAAVQRVKLQGKEESSPQPTVFQLVSKEPYNNIIKGLKEVIFPLLADPCSNLEDRDHQDQDLVVHKLVSLFVQELWLEKPIPRQFLSNLLYQCDNGYPVVNSLILAFGGEKSVSNWIQKDDS